MTKKEEKTAILKQLNKDEGKQEQGQRKSPIDRMNDIRDEFYSLSLSILYVFCSADREKDTTP